MASSVDSVHTDSDGAGNGARTPTRQVHASAATAAAATSELSPPGSQPQTIPGLSTVGALGSLGEPDSTQPNGKGFDAPIASWKSKRAQEEYQRAMENVIDQDFNLNEFGDPFDERDLEQKLL
ncbi:hypothetical protein N7481_005525 [Penicillium waksmanii]|uniref:uncharacterized protein n=1 Tax=Penicillium waksmanii TaxID=69791 RepID=UPI002548D85F|nr:uncharacterized protein N7481_005525 [Penicillium waksmanii]KAJ5983426.1 hypothetical protein N7481_005525 [Penicillium waksmanii]